MQAKVLGHACIAETKTRYAWRNDMEGLLCAVAIARERVGVRKRVDDSLNLDER